MSIAGGGTPDGGHPGEAAAPDSQAGQPLIPVPSPAAAPAAAGPGEDPVESLEHQLSLLWRRARSNSHRIARQVHPDMESSAYGLLVLLQRCGAMRLTDLAAEIGVGKPSVSRQVVMLEKLGLVRREADPADGRAQAISLTDEGTRRLAAVQQARKGHFRELLAHWPQDDITQLAQLLDKLNRSYSVAAASAGQPPAGRGPEGG